jgi:hypothetical protein
VVGAHANLAQVERLAAPIRRTGPIVVAGYGTVGGKVVEMLRDARELTVVIDQQLAPGVDIVGNVLEHATLERANVRAASAVVLALSNDSEGVFATAVVRDYAPEVPLIVRVNRAPNVRGCTRRAPISPCRWGRWPGKFSPTICSASRRWRSSSASSSSGGRRRAGGPHPWRAQVRERTGAAVVAVERDQNVFVKFDDAFGYARTTPFRLRNARRPGSVPARVSGDGDSERSSQSVGAESGLAARPIRRARRPRQDHRPLSRPDDHSELTHQEGEGMKPQPARLARGRTKSDHFSSHRRRCRLARRLHHERGRLRAARQHRRRHHRRGGRRFPVRLLGLAAGGLIGSIVTATVGAVVLLFLIGLIKNSIVRPARDGLARILAARI